MVLNEDKSPMNLVNIKKQLLSNKKGGKDGKSGVAQDSPRIDIRRPPRLPNSTVKPPLKQQDGEAQEEMQTPRALNDMENGDVSVHGAAAGEKSSKSNKFKTEAKENNGGKTSEVD